MYPTQVTDSNPLVPPARQSLRERFLGFLSANPNAFWVAVGLILVAGVLSRFLFIDAKAFHHDESLHAYYSYRVATGSPHEYSALLHGPFLYYFVGVFMWFFGANDTAARSAAAVFSLLLIALPLITLKQLGRAATLALMILIMASPTFWYFGRFLREDAFTSFWVLGTVLGSALFWNTQKPWALYFATSMLAFHFVNKENSFLHVFLWLLGLVAIVLFQKKCAFGFDGDKPANMASPILDRRYLVINSVSIFATIFVLFYSSFFRHSKGSLHGILDGLYRESLLYWWDQNQKRRIDGPFDYHLPLIANYEFFVLPFLVAGWGRAIHLSRKVGVSFWNNKSILAICAVALFSVFFVPRVALVADACSYTSYCLSNLWASGANQVEALVRLAHISHSRQVLQIVCYVLFGATAFFASLQLRHKFDAFIWFWFTGAIGVYSYVGEKVPWLVVYILLPLFVLAALEIGRLFSNKPGNVIGLYNSELANSCGKYSNTAFVAAVVWIVFAFPFSVFKGWRVAFQSPDEPQERLVFTQTTQKAKLLPNRWRAAREKEPKAPFKIVMVGDATWPYAWYVNEFKAGDFTKPTPENVKQVDAIFLDQSELEKAKKEFPNFRIYSLSMRHWWVPGQNPSLQNIFGYFFKRELYPRVEGAAVSDQGVGDTKVLYLENQESVVLKGLEAPDFMELLLDP